MTHATDNIPMSVLNLKIGFFLTPPDTPFVYGDPPDALLRFLVWTLPMFAVFRQYTLTCSRRADYNGLAGLKICRRNGVKVIIVVDNKKFVDRLQ
jgi:hypothetical protein